MSFKTGDIVIVNKKGESLLRAWKFKSYVNLALHRTLQVKLYKTRTYSGGYDNVQVINANDEDFIWYPEYFDLIQNIE